MLQFGLCQVIPNPPHNLDKVHHTDMRGHSDTNWVEEHQRWITIWKERHKVHHRHLSSLSHIVEASRLRQVLLFLFRLKCESCVCTCLCLCWTNCGFCKLFFLSIVFDKNLHQICLVKLKFRSNTHYQKK